MKKYEEWREWRNDGLSTRAMGCLLENNLTDSFKVKKWFYSRKKLRNMGKKTLLEIAEYFNFPIKRTFETTCHFCGSKISKERILF